MTPGEVQASLLVSLPSAQRAAVGDLIAALAEVPGVVAVVLGGSRCVGTAQADSDVDLALCYRDEARFDIEAVGALARRHGQDATVPMHGFGAWGPWVDGGAWLRVAERQVDLLWRSLDRYEEVTADALVGRHQLHFGQQGPFGYASTFALGEIVHGRVMAGDGDALEVLRQRLMPYPEPLRRALVRDYLWEVEFGLGSHAAKAARAADTISLIGCLARYGWRLRHALLAHLGSYAIGDRHARLSVDADSADARAVMALAEQAVIAAALTGEALSALAQMRQAWELARRLTG